MTEEQREHRRRQQRDYHRRRRAQQPELYRKSHRAHYAKNGDKVRTKSQAYRDANREAVRAWHRNNYAKDPDRQRAKNLQTKFGISVERYAEMLAAQNGLCAICAQPPNRRRLAVDHDHQTGAVRGLLCERCNFALAMAERPGWVDQATKYLGNHRNSEGR
jgi:hypothetical protein